MQPFTEAILQKIKTVENRSRCIFKLHHNIKICKKVTKPEYAMCRFCFDIKNKCTFCCQYKFLLKKSILRIDGTKLNSKKYINEYIGILGKFKNIFVENKIELKFESYDYKLCKINIKHLTEKYKMQIPLNTFVEIYGILKRKNCVLIMSYCIWKNVNDINIWNQFIQINLKY